MAKGSKTKLRSQLDKLEARFEKTLERTFEKAMQIPQVERARTKALRAKETLDQVLLDLEHKGVDLKDPQDLIQKVGQRVLERAERIRAQVAETPYSPAWLKDLKLTVEDNSGEFEESLEDSDEERATGSVVETKRGKVTLATTAAEATESEAAADMEPETYATATKKGKPSKLKKATGGKSKKSGAEKRMH